MSSKGGVNDAGCGFLMMKAADFAKIMTAEFGTTVLLL